MNTTNAVSNLVGKLDPDLVINLAVKYGPKILAAIIVLFVGSLVGRYLGNALAATLSKRNMEPPARNLIVRILKLVIFAFSLIIALDNLGVAITPLVAGIGVAGVGIGLAMQGVLGNLIAGVFLILSKPFRVGEYIELLGKEGQVLTIELFSTHLLHADKSKVIIPNRKIIGEILHNYGFIRQLNLEVGISHQADISLALSIIKEVLTQNAKVLKEHTPALGVRALGDSSVTIAIMPWTSVENFGTTGSEIYQSVLDRFAKAGIEIQRQQYEIRVLNNGLAGANRLAS